MGALRVIEYELEHGTNWNCARGHSAGTMNKWQQLNDCGWETTKEYSAGKSRQETRHAATGAFSAREVDACHPWWRGRRSLGGEGGAPHQRGTRPRARHACRRSARTRSSAEASARSTHGRISCDVTAIDAIRAHQSSMWRPRTCVGVA